MPCRPVRPRGEHGTNPEIARPRVRWAIRPVGRGGLRCPPDDRAETTTASPTGLDRWLAPPERGPCRTASVGIRGQQGEIEDPNSKVKIFDPRLEVEHVLSRHAGDRRTPDVLDATGDGAKDILKLCDRSSGTFGPAPLIGDDDRFPGTHRHDLCRSEVGDRSGRGQGVDWWGWGAMYRISHAWLERSVQVLPLIPSRYGDSTSEVFIPTPMTVGRRSVRSPGSCRPACPSRAWPASGRCL
jgi:hypothetical protein